MMDADSGSNDEGSDDVKETRNPIIVGRRMVGPAHDEMAIDIACKAGAALNRYWRYRVWRVFVDCDDYGQDVEQTP